MVAEKNVNRKQLHAIWTIDIQKTGGYWYLWFLKHRLPAKYLNYHDADKAARRWRRSVLALTSIEGTLEHHYLTEFVEQILPLFKPPEVPAVKPRKKRAKKKKAVKKKRKVAKKTTRKKRVVKKKRRRRRKRKTVKKKYVSKRSLLLRRLNAQRAGLGGHTPETPSESPYDPASRPPSLLSDLIGVRL